MVLQPSCLKAPLRTLMREGGKGEGRKEEGEGKGGCACALTSCPIEKAVLVLTESNTQQSGSFISLGTGM